MKKSNNWITKLIDYTFSGGQGFQAIRQATLNELELQMQAGHSLVNVWLDNKTSKVGHVKATFKFSDDVSGASKKPYPKSVYDPIFSAIEIEKKNGVVIVDRNSQLEKSSVAKAIMAGVAQFMVKKGMAKLACAQNVKYCTEKADFDLNSLTRGHLLSKTEAKANAEAARKEQQKAAAANKQNAKVDPKPKQKIQPKPAKQQPIQANA